MLRKTGLYLRGYRDERPDQNLKQLAAANRIGALYVPGNYQAKEYDAQYPVKEYALYDKIQMSDNVLL